METDPGIPAYAAMALEAALAAGREILAVYASDFAVRAKADRSPLTAADTRAHQTIVRVLASSGLPLLSEEGRHQPYDQRRRWHRLWIVDPLDGTKEFVSRNGEFTVNIALVENHRPILGIVYAPVADRLYLALHGQGAWRIRAASALDREKAAAGWRAVAEPLPDPPDARRVFKVVGSRSHANPALDEFLARLRGCYQDLEFTAAGSALKFCLLAEGRAALYPRPAPTMEWDTAAGQCLVEAIGGRVLIWGTDRPLDYNRQDLVNPGFIALGPEVDPAKVSGVMRS